MGIFKPTLISLLNQKSWVNFSQRLTASALILLIFSLYIFSSHFSLRIIPLPRPSIFPAPSYVCVCNNSTWLPFVLASCCPIFSPENAENVLRPTHAHNYIFPQPRPRHRPRPRPCPPSSKRCIQLNFRQTWTKLPKLPLHFPLALGL